MLLTVVIPPQCLQFDTPEPRLGYTFALQLSGHDETDRAVDPRLMVTLRAVATPFESDGEEPEERFPVRLTVGAADIYYRAQRRLDGAVDLRLTLYDGADIGVPHSMPKVRGKVTRLRLMEELFRWEEQLRSFSNDFYDVSRRRFVDIDIWPYRHLWWPQDFDEDQAEHWAVTAVVVDLDVPSAAQQDARS